MQIRENVRQALLTDTGWDKATLAPLADDASTRSYSRLTLGGKTALLMDAPPSAESAICPPEADEATRRGLGYNALARLSAGRLEAFVAISNWLQKIGVRAPQIYGYEAGAGYAVIEDFGAHLLRDRAPTDEAGLYAKALDVLRLIRQHPVTPSVLGDWPLLSYDVTALGAETDLFTEWYVPKYAATIGQEADAEWQQAWQGVFDRLSPPSVLVLRDYHAENILVGDDGKLAVIDFQDALVGQAAYDTVSLLEDARRDVDLGLAAELMQEDARSTDDEAAYMTDYAILALQRNMKILGVFARLIHRDGKDKYNAFFPRVRSHVARDLDQEAVAPLRQWTEKYMPDLLSDGGRS